MRSLILILALTGCGGTVVKERIVTVNVPVSVPCRSGDNPAAVASLKSQHPRWAGYTVKQKAALVAAQALAHKSYGQGVTAVTSGCVQ